MERYTTTRLTLPEVRNLVRDLPGVLCGRRPDRFQLRQAFVGAFARELYRLGYDSFRIRSAGAAVAGFPSWSPLHASTIRRKASPKARTTLYDRPESINIRSGRLMASFAPGTATPSGYIPVNSDQRVILRTNSVELISLVKYALKVLSLRPVWPADMRDLIVQATRAGSDAVANQLQQVLRVR